MIAGIIPARAGFTSDARPLRPEHPDHPRSRGVYRLPRSTFPVGVGSSPLARGLLYFEASVKDVGRIIPARAGFTRSRNGPSGRS